LELSDDRVGRSRRRHADADGAGQGNALNLEFLAALADALDEIARSPARAAVITGQGASSGPGSTCRAAAGGPNYVRQFFRG